MSQQLEILQLPFSMQSLTDVELADFLDRIRNQRRAWMLDDCVIVKQLATQLAWEQQRRRDNALDPENPKESMMLELYVEGMSPKQALLSLKVFYERSGDEGISEGVGQVCDLICRCMMVSVGYFLRTAYPD